MADHGRARQGTAGAGRDLSRRIPRARLRILDEAGHLYSTEQPDVDDEIARFFLEAG